MRVRRVVVHPKERAMRCIVSAAVLAAAALAHGQCVPSPDQFCVIVGNKTAGNPNPGGESMCYYINGLECPALSLERGRTYFFRMVNVPALHPFYISTNEVGAGSGLYTNGVTPPTGVSGNLVLTFAVPAAAPDQLYYQCAHHERMGWRLDIVNAACYANCDGSTVPPVLNVSDFICFQSKYAAGDSYANCDGSTVQPLLNVSDFICFQSRYAAGCS
jgi:hypothetical protein